MNNNKIVFSSGSKTYIDYTKFDEHYPTEDGYKVDLIVVQDPAADEPEVIAEIEYDVQESEET